MVFWGDSTSISMEVEVTSLDVVTNSRACRRRANLRQTIEVSPVIEDFMSRDFAITSSDS